MNRHEQEAAAIKREWAAEEKYQECQSVLTKKLAAGINPTLQETDAAEAARKEWDAAKVALEELRRAWQAADAEAGSASSPPRDDP